MIHYITVLVETQNAGDYSDTELQQGIMGLMDQDYFEYHGANDWRVIDTRPGARTPAE